MYMVDIHLVSGEVFHESYLSDMDAVLHAETIAVRGYRRATDEGKLLIFPPHRIAQIEVQKVNE